MNQFHYQLWNRPATDHTSYNHSTYWSCHWCGFLTLFCIMLSLSAIDICGLERGMVSRFAAAGKTLSASSGVSARRHEEAVPALKSLITSLTATDYAGINRINDPVTSGVPLPASLNITSIGQLSLVDQSGNVVPSQYSGLSRWDRGANDSTKPIRWVLVDFQANVSANETATYSHMGAGNGGSAAPSNVIIDSQVDKFIVTTGGARYQVPKNHFNLFDYVWIDKDGDGNFTTLDTIRVTGHSVSIFDLVASNL